MTLIRNIKALITDDKDLLRKGTAVVMFTSDDRGETLSIGDGATFQYTMKYADIEKMVEKERSFKYKKSHLIIDEGDADD